MIDIKPFKDQLLAKVFTRYPALFRRWVRKHQFVEFDDVPWAPFKGSLGSSRVAVLTTAGVHLKKDAPFNMHDPAGDPTFRQIPADAQSGDWTITHNYYDHSDADKDINVVFPFQVLRDLVSTEEIGSVNHRHFSFMGHILPPHIHTLMHKTAPQVVELLKQDGVDIALLTPA